MALFNLQSENTRTSDASTGRIIAVPASNVEPATVFRSIETRPLQGLPANINRTVKQVNVKSALPRTTTSKGLIDVINNFDWTTTPSRAASGQDFKIPSVRVQEFELSRFSAINSIKYQLQAFSDLISDNADAYARIFELANAYSTAEQKLQPNTQSTAAAVGQTVGAFTTNTITNAVNLLNTVGVQNLTSGVSTFVKSLVGSIENLFDSTGDATNSEWLKMLNGLYTIKSTDFEYIFPYMENTAMNSQTQFAAIDSVLKGSISRDLVNVVSKNLMTDALISGAELSQPGIYIEQPQLMNISSSTGADVTVSFPLLNTLSYENAVKNYQLLWLLAFQNKPYRQSKTVVSPAKIYRVYIPGTKYMHFAHLASLSVDFLGVRRTVQIPMPSVKGTPNNVNVVMPDAYNVTMKFSSLTTDMGNFMIEQLKRGGQF